MIKKIPPTAAPPMAKTAIMGAKTAKATTPISPITSLNKITPVLKTKLTTPKRINIPNKNVIT